MATSPSCRPRREFLDRGSTTGKAQGLAADRQVILAAMAVSLPPYPPARQLWHPWLRVERLLRVIRTEPWSREAWERLKQAYPKLWRERERVKRAGWFN